ncbi:hypothetical protein [Tunturiibacter gelidiferens]|uniref:hypothetical protein n=1 Tax=Tunturiibacter gelidiferens TaxID=3069689 RepID=UPI003D9B11BF
MNRLLKAAVALLCVGFTSLCHAQMTTVTAHSISMGGVPIAIGKVSFTPVALNGQPISFVGGEGEGLNSPKAFTCAITAGAIAGTCQIPDSALTTPANILYAVQITNTASQSAFVFPPVPNITGATWALDAYAPPAQTTNVQPIQSSFGSVVPTTCNMPSLFTLYVDGVGTLENCVGHVYVVLSTGDGSGNGSTGPAGPQGPIGLTGATGAQGPIGLTGPQGPIGLTGAAGATGANGADSTVPGPAGPVGPQGPAGSDATVVYGTTAGTSAQGNDSRIVGATQGANNLSDISNAPAALANIGAAASGANNDITSLGALSTPINAAQGGTGTASLSGVRKANGGSADTAAVCNTDIVCPDPVNNSQLLWQVGSAGDVAVTVSSPNTVKEAFFATAGQIEESDNGGPFFVPVKQIVSGNTATMTVAQSGNTATLTVVVPTSGAGTPSAFIALTDAATVTLSTAGASTTNATLAMAHTLASRTINVSGLVNGSFFNLEAIQDATGGAALVLGTGCSWQNVDGGTTASVATAASAVTNFTVFYDGTSCFFAQRFPKVTVAGDVATFSNVNGTTADSGTPIASLLPKANPVFTGQIEGPIGTCAAPTFAFGSLNTGWFNTSNANMQLCLNAVQALNITSAGLFLKNEGIFWGSSFSGNSAGISISLANSYLTANSTASGAGVIGAPMGGTYEFNPIQAITAAATITPTSATINLSGSITITTITPPAGVNATTSTRLHILPAAGSTFSFATGGNIAGTMPTVTVGVPLEAEWFGTAWFIK